jgi:ring-1,2-phenylacetyl-CoA epoxidase subunit PaaC
LSPDTALTCGPVAEPASAVYACRLGDDALILAQRLGEWITRAPQLEEDVALANIGLDLLGQARFLLSYTGECEGKGRDEDALAYLRDERAFGNVILVEQPRGDFAATMARLLVFSAYQFELYQRLTASADDTLAAIAAKAVKEVAYHRDHAEQWTLRLGDGTDASHERMRRACEALWRFTGEMFQPVRGLDADLPGMESAWLESVGDILRRATLVVPEGPRSGAWTAGAGRQGLHTEPFGRMLAEMQHLHRSHPGASW